MLCKMFCFNKPMQLQHQPQRLYCLSSRGSYKNQLVLSVILTLILVWLIRCSVTTDFGSIKDIPLYNSSRTKDLLLFSYMRSGSTLTSELLRDSPGTFFVFEPLIPLAPYHYFTNDSVCNMRDTACSQENAKARIREALDTVKHLFSCNIRAVPRSVISEIFKQNKSGTAWEKYRKCLNTRSFRKEKCLFEIEHSCRKAETRTLKVLRLSFIHAEELLRTLPNLNVLLLYRDPRAIINSRIETDWFPVTEDEPEVVTKNIESLCEKMVEDMQILEKAKWRFNERISERKIEAVTKNAQGMVHIFNFINKTSSKHDKDRINSIMVQKRKNCLFRDWTQQLKTVYRVQTETKCKPIIKDSKSLYETK